MEFNIKNRFGQLSPHSIYQFMNVCRKLSLTKAFIEHFMSRLKAKLDPNISSFYWLCWRLLIMMVLLVVKIVRRIWQTINVENEDYQNVIQEKFTLLHFLHDLWNLSKKVRRNPLRIFSQTVFVIFLINMKSFIVL